MASMDVAAESTSRFCAYCNVSITKVTETTGQTVPNPSLKSGKPRYCVESSQAGRGTVGYGLFLSKDGVPEIPYS